MSKRTRRRAGICCIARLLNMPRRISAYPRSVNIVVRAFRGRLSLWDSMKGNLGEERKRKDNK